MSKVVFKNPLKDTRQCYGCGKVGHLVAQCKVVAAAKKSLQLVKQVPVKVAVGEKRPPPKPVVKQAGAAKVVANVSAAKVGKAIEKRLARSGHEDAKDLRQARGMIEHGVPSMSGRHSHGSVRHLGHGRDKHGDHEVYEFEYRVEVIELDEITAPGTVLVRVPMHTSTLGPVATEMLKSYTMYLIEAIDGYYDSEIAFIDEEARGAMYMAYNTNSNVAIPYGSLGPEFVSTWRGSKGRNFMPCPLKRADDVHFHADLALESQVPRYISKQADDNWDTQGLFIVMASTALDSGGNQIELGEFYLKSRVRVYSLAAESDDLDGDWMMAWGLGLSAAYTTWGNLGQWWGAKGLIYFPPTIAGGVGTFVVVSTGTYTVEIDSYINGTGTAATDLGTLTYFAKTDQPSVLQLSAQPLTCPYSTSGANIVFSPIWLTSAAPTDAAYCTTNDSGGTPAQVGNGKRIIKLIYAFSCAAGSVFTLIGPTYSGQSTGNLILRFTKINQHYTAMIGDMRPTPQVSLASMRPDQQVLIDKCTREVCCEPSEAEYAAMMRWIANNGASCPAECNMVITKLNLPMPLFTNTTMILPAVAAVVTWAATTFGPMLVKAGLDWVSDRLDGGHRVSPKRRRRE